jgi:tetratricopeptide (TPR) repeat protein
MRSPLVALVFALAVGCTAAPPPAIVPEPDPLSRLARASFLRARHHYQELRFRQAERELDRAIKLAPQDLAIQDLYHRVVFLTQGVRPWERASEHLDREARFQEAMALLLAERDQEGAARARWRAAFLRARLGPPPLTSPTSGR